MVLTFAGEQLGAEDFGGDTIRQFLPAGEQQVDVSRPLRAEWAIPYARGNRLHTISFGINLGVEASTGDMLARLSLFFGNLPTAGALIWSESGRTLSCDVAVLKEIRPEQRQGCSGSILLTFLGGQIAEVFDYLLTETGDALLAESGAYLET